MTKIFTVAVLLLLSSTLTMGTRLNTAMKNQANPRAGSKGRKFVEEEPPIPDEEQTEEEKIAFANFASKFNRKYDSLQEAKKRRGIYAKNLRKIKEHKLKGKRTYDIDENQFIDWTD